LRQTQMMEMERRSGGRANSLSMREDDGDGDWREGAAARRPRLRKFEE
ncbi:hypothetical protein SOVF_087930, partial [Spinacia oleracea]